MADGLKGRQKIALNFQNDRESFFAENVPKLGEFLKAVSTHGSLVTMTDLQRCKALRQDPPVRVVLQSLDHTNTEHAYEGWLRLENNFEHMVVHVDFLHSGMGSAQIKETSQAGEWHIHGVSTQLFREGEVVLVHDATPTIETPEMAHDEEDGVKSLNLHTQSATSGSLAWQPLGGFADAECPRALDGVDVSFVVWACRGPAGKCQLVQKGEDPTALICEYGPRGIRESLQRMVPGDSRRFWIPKEIEDRRFGHPPPDRFLPVGDIVVDLTLRSIDREAVFEYKLNEDQIRIQDASQRHPIMLAKRALGVLLSFVPNSMLISQYYKRWGDPSNPTDQFLAQAAYAWDDLFTTSSTHQVMEGLRGVGIA